MLFEVGATEEVCEEATPCNEHPSSQILTLSDLHLITTILLFVVNHHQVAIEREHESPTLFYPPLLYSTGALALCRARNKNGK